MLLFSPFRSYSISLVGIPIILSTRLLAPATIVLVHRGELFSFLQTLWFKPDNGQDTIITAWPL